jgi:hypothetical protein
MISVMAHFSATDVSAMSKSIFVLKNFGGEFTEVE